MAPSLLSWDRCFHDLEKTCNIITLQKVEMLRNFTPCCGGLKVNPKTWLLVGDAMLSSRLRLIRTETEVQSEIGHATILFATSSVTLQQSPALFDITYYDCESTWALLQRLLS
jgi:hypothetical protein